MKAVHLNTYTQGGAAEAALRIHQTLMQAGVDSHFLALYKAGCTVKNVEDFRDSLHKMRAFHLKARNKIQALRREKIYGNAGELFNDLKAVWNVKTHALVQNSEVAHLHWIDAYVNIPAFFENYPGKIVWTLHDHFPFSGGFHYPPKTMRALWEQKVDEQKKLLQKLFEKRPIDIVLPSQHLQDLAAASGVLGKSRLQVIKNPVDTGVFKPLDKTAAKKTFGIHAQEKVLFFISDHLQYARKGFALLEKALHTLQSPVTLLAAGRGTLPATIGKNKVVQTGHVSDKQKLVELYNAADVLVNPSLEDISSNTVMEAMACGVPALVFETGGIPELISAVNGVVLKEKNADSLARGIDEMLSKTFDANAIRQKAISEHGLQAIGEKYAQVYRSQKG